MSEVVERVARAIFKSFTNWDPDRIAVSGQPAWKFMEEEARAAIEAMGLSEVVSVLHEDFLAFEPFQTGRPLYRSAARWGEQMWPQPDSKYRVFIMAKDA